MGMYSTIHSNNLDIPPIKNPIKVDESDQNYEHFLYVANMLEMNIIKDSVKELGKESIEYVVGIENCTDSTYNDTKMYMFDTAFPAFIKVLNKACGHPATGSFIKVDEEHNFIEYEANSDGECFRHELKMEPVRQKSTLIK